MTREEAIEEINKVFEPAFANYIITALTGGATVSDKELEQEPCEDCIKIPEGATNGDMINAMFPNCEISEHKVKTMSQGEIVVGYDVFLYISRSTKSEMRFGIKIFFDIMWWNAPYEAERSRNDKG